MVKKQTKFKPERLFIANPELLAKVWVDKMQSHFEWIFRLD